MSTFYTVGHSTRPLAEFVDILNSAEVRLLADVRTVPRSRTNPQFNADTLPKNLAEAGIAWRHIATLGGLRSSRRGSPSPNDFWENASFRHYADYAAGAEFRQGLEELRTLGRNRTCAIMCAEAVWWRCHRRIIADYLIAEGETVMHIMGSNKFEPARLTPAAQRLPDGTLIYPRRNDPHAQPRIQE
ncbi:MAG: DUF488 family protein [Rhizomicrobium sp.]